MSRGARHGARVRARSRRERAVRRRPCRLADALRRGGGDCRTIAACRDRRLADLPACRVAGRGRRRRRCRGRGVPRASRMLRSARPARPPAIDQLEHVVGGAYQPGAGRDASATRAHGTSAISGAASALLTAYAITGRLPYSMLAEELMQTARRDESRRSRRASDGAFASSQLRCGARPLPPRGAARRRRLPQGRGDRCRDADYAASDARAADARARRHRPPRTRRSTASRSATSAATMRFAVRRSTGSAAGLQHCGRSAIQSAL